ncbi:E3 ubiquitin ligase BIG BROTHER-related-like [Musa acuminata AAA Group]|uniref:E3 ubiquitin ligase BIG BROTHER-related-like n=1 Tax=Musa acuminata AAA Group TaxID=214697 RepID=UPI0031DFA7DF
MLRMNGVDCSDYGISDAGSYDYEEGAGPCDRGRRGEHRGERLHEDAFDANDPDVDDETFAMALQDSEEQEVAVRLMAVAGVSDDHDDHGDNSQDAWQEVDPDEYSYEELNALGEVVGTESRGLSADVISALPSVSYKANNVQDSNSEQYAYISIHHMLSGV